MHHFMSDKRIMLLKAGGHVNHIPKASPALEPAKVHVEQDWAFGGADHTQGKEGSADFCAN